MKKIFNFNTEEIQKRFETFQKSIHTFFLFSILPPVPLHFSLREMKRPSAVTDSVSPPAPKG